LFKASWALRASPKGRLLELIGENLFQAVTHDRVIVC